MLFSRTALLCDTFKDRLLHTFYAIGLSKLNLSTFQDFSTVFFLYMFEIKPFEEVVL